MDVVETLGEDLAVNLWSRAEVYFGGVHAVMRRPDGSVQAVGDPRRKGSTSIVTAEWEIIEPPLT
jgi:gamma-glutamyltranspeptidase